MGVTCSLLIGCSGALSVVDPAGPAARTISTLWWVMLAGAAAILGMVLVLLGAAFRAKEIGDADETAGIKVWIVGLGLVFSMSVLAALTVYGLHVGHRLMPRAGADVVAVSAEARQWNWRFAYGNRPGHTTDGVLHIPAGRPVDVAITSLDVVHSFWVPRLAGKLDAIPGHVNTLRIEADMPGSYQGLSAEYNGPGYRTHVFTVKAHDAEAWDAFMSGAEQ
ncbi:cytochrome B [Sulfitobacter dubius]|jgi:cytochrome c oxidase subunit 2/cytochrome aa3-600 menaquinol oxidase subunit 2|uniref:cytochrome c oxidase subunit II n=1 Tax=Sulfitobacter dubius TaxID=218673 RepID=UPI0030DAEE3D|tara:strand:+ start:112 stop:774 length:663 start_codon:yes stop_codon:yes gene_type:complete